MKHLFKFVKLLCISYFIISFDVTYAQETIKFGKIDISDLKMNKCPLDSFADAMVLADIGETYFSYEENLGFRMMFERLIRMKIFTKQGYPYANIEIPYYRSSKDEEMIISLKAKTYNLENGKIAETKVTDESIFTEEVDAYWRNKRITFPNLKEGSIVELKYTIKSPFRDIFRNWYFQGTLPVKLSEYEVRIPEYFFYTRQFSGSFPLTRSDTTYGQGHIDQLINERGDPNSPVTTHSVYKAATDYVENIFHYTAKDVPAFKEEPYTSTITNYVSKMVFEYTGCKYPNSSFRAVNSTWMEVVEDLDNDEDFGHQIRKGGLVKEIVSEIEGKAKEPFDKMVLAYEYIKNTMKWNEINSKYPTTHLRNALQLKTGNSADINLLLILLLRELGLSADPVILSTRQNGVVLKSQPSLRMMNYVIAVVLFKDTYYLLDATSRHRPYTMLPFRCLNGDGLVVSKESLRWLPMVQDEKDNKLYFADMKILPDGEIKGTFEVSLSGYAGLNARTKFAQEGIDNFKKSLKENLKNWTVEDITIENMENHSETVKCTYRLSNSDPEVVNDSMLYLDVFLDISKEKNPFKQESRDYPVDFGCPQREAFVFNYEIPEGYIVESLPEPLKIALPEQAGTFKFAAGVAANKISISSQLIINKTHFPPSEYIGLRDFYNKINAKHAQKIVLKKAG